MESESSPFERTEGVKKKGRRDRKEREEWGKQSPLPEDSAINSKKFIRFREFAHVDRPDSELPTSNSVVSGPG